MYNGVITVKRIIPPEYLASEGMDHAHIIINRAISLNIYALLSDIVNAVCVIPVLLGSGFCRVTDGEHGKGLEVSRQVEGSGDNLHPILVGRYAQHNGSQSLGCCLQPEVFTGDG